MYFYSQYYSRFSGLYKELLLLSPGNSTDYVDGYNDAMSSVVSENPVQGLFQGMWASVMLFISTVANGVGIGGITVMSILSVLAILVLVWFVIKILKGG